jgi:fatty-acyl-CoA synthase
MNVGDWLTRREMLSPNKVALLDTLNSNRQITYRQWNKNANQMANFLQQKLGIQKGDRVAVLSYNCVEYLDIWFAMPKMGAILQNLNWRLAPAELIQLIEDASPKILVYGGDQAKTVDEIRRANIGIEHFIALGSKANQADITIDERFDYPPALLQQVNLGWNDPWMICYTGGTSGTPKGAVLTYRAITANAVNTIISWGLAPDDVTILNAPLFHSGGLNVFTSPLVYIGGSSIVCKEFDLEQTFDLLTSGRVTIWFGVPTMFIMMQNHPLWEAADFKHLKLMISGGAPCPLPVFEKFWAKGVDFKTGYGLTEAGPNTFWLPPEDVRRKPGSVGFPLFHIDVKVVQADGRECDPEQIGELLIHGPHVCQGYWNNPQATAQAFRTLPDDPQGSKWLYTGDLARYDEEGYYFIVGRSKDMYISGGENIYPSEIESVLHEHLAVAEAAVIAVPDETWGEVGRAIVVLKSELQLTEETLSSYMRQRLAGYKVPKSIIFASELPKTGANKIDKAKLGEIYG